MRFLKKCNDVLWNGSKYVAIAMYVIMLFTASLQILMRFIFKSPLAWTDEAAKYSFVWGTMLGCAILVRTGGHSCVELLGNALKGTAKKVHAAVLDVCCLVLYGVVVYGGIVLMQAGATSVSPALSLPMWLVYLIMPISGAFMVLFQLEQLLRDLVAFRKGEETK